jgi:DNA-binding SARP family transcriptional activator
MSSILVSAGPAPFRVPEATAPVGSRPVLHARLFGPFSVAIDGRPVDVAASRRVRSLLGYLLLQARPVPAVELQQQLWPGSSDRSARNCLHVAVCHARAALRAATPIVVVEYQQGSYALSPEIVCRTDVEEFTTCLERAAAREGHDEEVVVLLRRAVALSAEVLLAGDRGQPWLAERRERLHHLALDARLSLAERLLARGEVRESVELARSIASADPLDERAHRLAIRGLVEGGQAHRAHEQLDRCRAALAVTGRRPHAATVAAVMGDEQLALFG